MKRINSLKLAFTFAGCFLGAGYVSGQELWQFFGSFGTSGLGGIILAVIILVIFGTLLIRTAQLKGVSEMDKVVISSDSKFMRGLFISLEIFFLFGIYVVMTAGAGALLNQIFALPGIIGNICFAVVVTAIALAGMNGMITAFSITVPLMVIMSLIVFAVTAVNGGLNHISFSTVTNDNPLISNWIISAVVFASYNLFASIGIMTPLGEKISRKSTLYIGIISGGVMLLLIAFSVIFSLASQIETVSTQLPMLAKASSLGTAFQYIFAFLLFGGMLGTSVSSVFAIAEYIRIKKDITENRNRIIIILMSVLSVFGSMFGFNKLIGTVYPICGYLGFIGMVLIAINYTKAVKNAGVQEVK